MTPTGLLHSATNFIRRSILQRTRAASRAAAIYRQAAANQFYNDIEGHAEETLLAHPALLEALQQRRTKAAGTLMRDHIMSGADELIAMLEMQLRRRSLRGPRR